MYMISQVILLAFMCFLNFWDRSIFKEVMNIYVMQSQSFCEDTYVTPKGVWSWDWRNMKYGLFQSTWLNIKSLFVCNKSRSVINGPRQLRVTVCCTLTGKLLEDLTHWGPDKMVDILQMTVSNALQWKKIAVFDSKLTEVNFPKVQSWQKWPRSHQQHVISKSWPVRFINFLETNLISSQHWACCWPRTIRC